MNHQQIWQAIEKFARANNMSCSGLARRGGLDPTTFNKSKRWTKDGKPRWPSTHSLAKILECTGRNIKDFVAFLERDRAPEIWEDR